MEYSYIVNPLTNRKVSIHSRKGQSILRAYIHQVQVSQAGGAKQASQKKGECLQNPVTKRCGYSNKHTERDVTDENGRKITICTTRGATKKGKYRPCHTTQEYKDYIKRQKEGRAASHVHHHDPAIVEYSHHGEVVRPGEEDYEDPWEQGSDESHEGWGERREFAGEDEWGEGWEEEGHTGVEPSDIEGEEEDRPYVEDSESSYSDEASGFGAEHESEFGDDYCKTTYKDNKKGCESHPNCTWATPGKGKSGKAYCRTTSKKYKRAGPVLPSDYYTEE